MGKTNQETKYENLAKEVISEGFTVSANIAVGSTICRLEIQPPNNDEDPAEVVFQLPISDERAIEEIKKAVATKTE